MKSFRKAIYQGYTDAFSLVLETLSPLGVRCALPLIWCITTEKELQLQGSKALLHLFPASMYATCSGNFESLDCCERR